MLNLSRAPASSSSSSSSRNKRKDKRKAKEDFLRNLVVEEVEKYLDKYKKNFMSEFPPKSPLYRNDKFLEQGERSTSTGCRIAKYGRPGSYAITSFSPQ